MTMFRQIALPIYQLIGGVLTNWFLGQKMTMGVKTWTISASRVSYSGNQVYFEGGNFAIRGKDGENAAVRRGCSPLKKFCKKYF